mmetsp:Transcript_19300/g.62949  ORF Transcript_19300/g.62949 Transcript_19300/m.62949 type:complete len:226 (-) Transcript_19300:288-965(-)
MWPGHRRSRSAAHALACNTANLVATDLDAATDLDVATDTGDTANPASAAYSGDRRRRRGVAGSCGDRRRGACGVSLPIRQRHVPPPRGARAAVLLGGGLHEPAVPVVCNSHGDGGGGHQTGHPIEIGRQIEMRREIVRQASRMRRCQRRLMRLRHRTRRRPGSVHRCGRAGQPQRCTEGGHRLRRRGRAERCTGPLGRRCHSHHCLRRLPRGFKRRRARRCRRRR